LIFGQNGIGGSDGYNPFDRKGFLPSIAAAEILDLPIICAGPSINNKLFFEAHPRAYKKLEIIYDLNREELRDLYQKCSIAIMPSSVEAGWPNLTMLEAMSVGLPVIGTYNGEGIIHPDLVVKRNKNQIVDAIEKVFSNYEHYSDYSRLVAEQNTWEKVVDELEKMYEKALELL